MARLHPVYGYDMDKVSKVLCLICDQPIGDEEYTEITNLARFGQMLFCHKRCEARRLMPRRTRPNKAKYKKLHDKQYKPKKMKRPRAWHHKGKPVWEIWIQLQRDRERSYKH